MKIIYFDICALALYLLILWTCYARGLTKGHANRLFVLMNWVSLFCAIADIAMEFVVNPVPLSQWRVVLGTWISFSYKLFRNGSMVIYLLYLFAITRTEHLIRPLSRRCLLWLPNGIVSIALLQNFFTHHVFVVTAETGYSRGPMLILLYVIALLYGLVGTAYCVYCRRYLTKSKWTALLSVYVLTFIGIGVELIKPQLLVEMFSTAVGVIMILLLVMRPEETMDGILGLQNWKAYRTDLENILKANDRIQILAIQIVNAQEMRSYYGEDRYNHFLREVSGEINAYFKIKKRHVNKELYIERPGTFYLTLDDPSYDLESMLPEFLERINGRHRSFSDNNLRFEVKLCLIRVPDDLKESDGIINIGHKFPQLGDMEQRIFLASEIIQSRDYLILSHMEEILNRAISDDEFEMYYQPIYHNSAGCFQSAEALLRLKDSKYGAISPAVFIPAAEANGLIFSIGELVLEKVFRFVAEHDLGALGLSFVDINLSVAQVLQSDLPNAVKRLQEKYHVKPDQINFEITETLYDNLSEVMDRNVRALKSMGYSFSLDDYGIGYSNIQRMSKLPLSIIKIDKSLVDEMFSDDGSVIIRNTIRMVQGIHKELVVEGVETKAEIDALEEMDCEYIQGFYYSKPLPEDEFVQFLRQRNQIA